MFQELLDYRTKHGDMLVPADFPENPQLGTWVDTQRQQFRIFYEEKQHFIHLQQQQQQLQQQQKKQSSESTFPTTTTIIIKPISLLRNAVLPMKKSNLTQERIDLLESNGFVWDVFALRWEERYQELVEYKNKHGTVIVPKLDQHETLYNWVFTQRRQYKLKLLGTEQSSLTQERIDKLDALGFIWNYQDEVWMEKFQQLQKFKKDYGHCLIPSTYFHRPLARWVEIQRMHYRNIHKHNNVTDMDDEDGADILHTSKDAMLDSPLTETRIQLLNNEGFVWDVAEYHWNILYQQLQDFVKINGHAFVPTSKPLGRWCQKQRIEYKKMMMGEKTSMTGLRQDKMIQLGFVFDMEKSRHIIKGSGSKKYPMKPKIRTIQ